MSNKHNRKCWHCGNVAEHDSRVVPGVLCKKCGSQDTRAVKEMRAPPATPAEITAAERAKFEAWVKEHSVTTDMIQRDQGGGYAIILVHWSWKAWCQALGCDPMGDCQ